MVEQPYLDVHALTQLHDIMGDELNALFTIFNRQMNETLSELNKLETNPELTEISALKKSAHKLKGSALSLHCKKIAEVCGELEQIAPSKPADYYRRLTEHFTDVMTQSLQALEKWESAIRAEG